MILMIFSIHFFIFVDTYFSGFGMVYFFGYILGTFCAIGSILGVMIYFMKSESQLDANKKDKST